MNQITISTNPRTNSHPFALAPKQFCRQNHGLGGHLIANGNIPYDLIWYYLTIDCNGSHGSFLLGGYNTHSLRAFKPALFIGFLGSQGNEVQPRRRGPEFLMWTPNVGKTAALNAAIEWRGQVSARQEGNSLWSRHKTPLQSLPASHSFTIKLNKGCGHINAINTIQLRETITGKDSPSCQRCIQSAFNLWISLPDPALLRWHGWLRLKRTKVRFCL